MFTIKIGFEKNIFSFNFTVSQTGDVYNISRNSFHKLWTISASFPWRLKKSNFDILFAVPNYFCNLFVEITDELLISNVRECDGYISFNYKWNQFITIEDYFSNSNGSIPSVNSPNSCIEINEIH